jgi:hypothetical protein
MNAIRSQSILAGVILSTTVAVTSSFAAPGKSNGQGGWEPSADHLESVVISIKSDPLVDPEPACVALQIGINLLSDTIKPPAAGVPVVPADEVILFPTLAGVEVVNPNNGTPGGDADDPLNAADCLSVTPDGNPTFVSLNGLLQRFDSLGGQVVTCPLCKATRFPDDAPNFGIVGNGVDIHYLFLNADKVIDF